MKFNEINLECINSVEKHKMIIIQQFHGNEIMNVTLCTIYAFGSPFLMAWIDDSWSSLFKKILRPIFNSDKSYSCILVVKSSLHLLIITLSD